MNKIIEKYNQYISNSDLHWKNRMIWCGINGKYPKPPISIQKFNSDTHILSEVISYNTRLFFDNVNDIANEYIKWIENKSKEYNKNEIIDLRNFFIGVLGELFFQTFLEEENIKVMNKHGQFIDYKFEYTSPNLKCDIDRGVDLTGYGNNVPCVMQIKFWNQSNKNEIGLSIIQKTFSEGIIHDWINKDDKNNVIICCLKDEMKIYDLLKSVKDINVNNDYDNHVIVIGKQSLKLNIDENYNGYLFWEKLTDKLENIK